MQPQHGSRSTAAGTVISASCPSNHFPLWSNHLGAVSVQGSGANGNLYRVLEADFGPSLTALTSSSGLKLLAANPPDGCLTFAHTTNYAGAAVLIQRDNCTFQTKACY